MNERKRVMFLFGAGTEGKGNYDLPNGYEYLKSSLFGNENKSSVMEALKEVFGNNTYFNGNYSYSVHKYSNVKPILKNLIMNRIISDSSFFENNKDIISELLDKKDFTELKEYENLKEIIDIEDIHSKNDKKYKKRINEIDEELMGLLTSEKKKDDIKDTLLKELFESDADGNAIVETNVGVGGLLDGYFHTIISPHKYGKYNFSKIFNYYWNCYFTIIEKVVEIYKNNPELLDYLDGDKLNYVKVIKDISKFSRILNGIDTNNYNTNSYYNLLKDEFDKDDSLEISGVATTNYFNFCEVLYKDSIYLNGKTNLFELPEVLEIIDALEVDYLDDKYLFMPFIFGQSHVKPIVHNHQIQEFSKFSEHLDNSDVLVVFGFNMNEDDNHINAFIHSFVKSEKKKLIVVGAGEEEETKRIARKIKCEDHEFEYCKVEYGNNKDVVDNIINSLKSI